MNRALTTKEQNYFVLASAEVEKVFKEWVIRSIQLSFEATKNGDGTPISSFILTSCAIDVLSGFLSGREISRGSKKRSPNLGQDYMNFLRKYMRQYPANKTYKALRGSLVHNFSPRTDLLLIHANSNLHMKQGKSWVKKVLKRGLIINFENFFEDFITASTSYFSDLQKSIDLKRKFLKHYRRFGFSGLKKTLLS